MSGRQYWMSDADSKSLWNYTLSPGWTNEACEVLRKAVIKYGCGNWKGIEIHFPNKTNGQLNLQTQRLFGQQSLAEFNKLHIDPKIIKTMNDKKENAQRKNGCVVNTGDNLTLEGKMNKRNENISKYCVPKEVYDRIYVPIIYDDIPIKSLQSKIQRLRKLWQTHRVLTDKLSKSNISNTSTTNITNLSTKIDEDIAKHKKKANEKNVESEPMILGSSNTENVNNENNNDDNMSQSSKQKKNRKRKKMDDENGEENYVPAAKKTKKK